MHIVDSACHILYLIAEDQGVVVVQKTVAVLGASPKRDRYSNMAVRRLTEKGYTVIPVNPAYDAVEGIDTVPALSAITGKVDTLTLYLNPYHVERNIDEILNLAPGRVIFNPGTESYPLMKHLDKEGIPYLEACTLVMLGTGQFDA